MTFAHGVEVIHSGIETASNLLDKKRYYELGSDIKQS